MIGGSGYQQTLVVWGLIQGILGILAALGLRTPPDGYLPAGYDPVVAETEMQSKRSYTPGEMLRNPIFYLLFLMMTMMSTGGLMVVLNVGPFAKQYGVAGVVVATMPYFGAVTALGLSLTLSRVTNGLTRPFFGWISDHIGREPTMALAFSLEAVAILVLFAFIDQPLLFVVLTGLVFFGWGEIFSLFPSTLTDTFGAKHAMTNYGFLYIAQGVGSILGGPAAAKLHDTTGSWTAVFILVACLDALTAILAIAVLRPMRQRHMRASG
jgi:MFS family permease